MIVADGPSDGGGDGGEPAPGQIEPAFNPAPLILTLAFGQASQARLDALRTAHFPPERNFVPAHLTLFHHLPAFRLHDIVRELGEVADGQPAFSAAIAGPRSLGRGVALAIAAPPLLALRARLARGWANDLTAQDRAGYRPHVTIQNKVAPAAARALLTELGATFAPFSIEAVGLLLWHYRGGPWDLAAEFRFTRGQ